MTIRAGLGVETRFVGWGAAIVDLDNDGLPDLFFTTGMVYPGSGAEAAGCPVQNAQRDLSQSGRRQVRRIARGGRARRCRKLHSSRGVAFGDFDNDGDIDILIMNMNEPPSLLRNDVSGSESLAEGAADRRGVEPQRDRRQVVATYGERRQAQAVLAQSSYLSVNDRRLHFGLGSGDNGEPGDSLAERQGGEVADVAADQLVVIREGHGDDSDGKLCPLEHVSCATVEKMEALYRKVSVLLQAARQRMANFH